MRTQGKERGLPQGREGVQPLLRQAQPGPSLRHGCSGWRRNGDAATSWGRMDRLPTAPTSKQTPDPRLCGPGGREGTCWDRNTSPPA